MSMNIQVTIDGKVIKLRKILVGGLTDDEMLLPCGLYGGDIDLVEGCIMLETALRAFTKIMHDDNNLDYDQISNLVEIARERAIQTEIKNEKKENLTIDEHYEFLAKWKKEKSQ